MSGRLAAAAEPAGLVDRMARTWAAPRAGASTEIETAGEARLCGYAFLGSALSAMAVIGAEALNPTEAAADMAGWASSQIAAGFFFRPLALYGVAALIGLACRAFGGDGGWRETRAALFWTGLVAAPPMVMLTLLGAAAAGLGGAPQAMADVAHMIGALLWVALLGPALAAAHGFASARSVYLGFAAFGAALAAAGYLL